MMELPSGFIEDYKKLSRDQQSRIIGQLMDLRKPLPTPAILKCKMTEDELFGVIAACLKYDVEYETEVKGKSVYFTFKSTEDRNKIMLADCFSKESDQKSPVPLAKTTKELHQRI